MIAIAPRYSFRLGHSRCKYFGHSHCTLKRNFAANNSSSSIIRFSLACWGSCASELDSTSSYEAKKERTKNEHEEKKNPVRRKLQP